ncbi:MAG: ABC transporter ATP-binding protein [Promethearchaeota archaeon]
MNMFDKRINTVQKKIQVSEADTVLVLENLSKKYGKHLAVDNVNIEVHEGETIGLVGPNGAGKTTTIKMIAKLLTPTEGRVLIKNRLTGNLQDLHKNSRDLVRRGFLIDQPFFYSDMTAYQHLKYFASSQHYPKDKIDDRIDYLLDLFKLNDWKHKKVKTYSKGMRQKLGIIQALLIDPQIIILDEPQTGLDPKARIEIRKIISHHKEEGKIIFVASHMLHEISEICDKIALINHGSIVAFDTLENLEKTLKKKELECKLFKPLEESKKAEIIERLIERLNPYLDHQKDSLKPIIYNSEKGLFKIFYNKGAESKVEILSILVKEFDSDFRVESFTEPKTTQLEKIYEEMIVDDEPKIKLKHKEAN